MALGVKINFVNFIAFPITFGIGVDYAVNVMARYLRDDRPNVAAAIKPRAARSALCSSTTIVGYSSLLFAKNVGLFLFGVVAVLGELACLVTAVVVLPFRCCCWSALCAGPRLQPFEWDKATGVSAAEAMPQPAPAPTSEVGS